MTRPSTPYGAAWRQLSIISVPPGTASNRCSWRNHANWPARAPKDSSRRSHLPCRPVRLGGILGRSSPDTLESGLTHAGAPRRGGTPVMTAAEPREATSRRRSHDAKRAVSITRRDAALARFLAAAVEPAIGRSELLGALAVELASTIGDLSV